VGTIRESEAILYTKKKYFYINKKKGEIKKERD